MSHKGAHWFIPIDQVPGGRDSLVTEINTPSPPRQSGCTETYAHKSSAGLYGLKWKLCMIYHASLESNSTRGNTTRVAERLADRWTHRNMNIAGGKTAHHPQLCRALKKNKKTSGVNWHPSLLSVYVTSQLTSARQWPSTCLCVVPQRCHKNLGRELCSGWQSARRSPTRT